MNHAAEPTEAGDLRPFVSVVLPVRNEASGISAALAALRQQTYPRHLIEIVVIDGRSTDRTAEIVGELARVDPRIRLVDNPAGVTPAGLNAGIAVARGDVIIRMDGHAIAQPDYVEQAVRLLEATGAWSVGGIMNKVGTSPTQQANALAASSPLGVGDAKHNYAKEAGWAETVFLGGWPRWVFDRVGLFDEELVRNQDDEHAFRIRQAGGRIWFDPSLVVKYTSRQGVSAIFEQYRQYGYWKVRVFQKHRGAARARHFVPATFVAAVVFGLVTAPWWRPGAAFLTATVGSYVLVVGGGTMLMDVPGTSRWRVCVSIAAMHVGYGIGFWQGLIAFRSLAVRRQEG